MGNVWEMINEKGRKEMNYLNREDWNCEITEDLKVVNCPKSVDLADRDVKILGKGQFDKMDKNKRELLQVGASNAEWIRKFLLSSYFVLEEIMILEEGHRGSRQVYRDGYVIYIIGKLKPGGLTIRK